MKKRIDTTVSLKDKAERVNAALSQLPEGTLNHIPASKLRPPDEDRKIREQTKAIIGDLQDHSRILGEVLADSESYEDQKDYEIPAEEDMLLQSVQSVLHKKGRYDVLREFMFAMIKYFPHTALGLNHLGNIGASIGFFRASSGNGEFSIELPLSDAATGQWKRTRVASDVPQAIKVMKQLLPILDEVEKAYEGQKAEHRQLMKEIRQGTTPLLEVLETGRGETFCYLPEKKEGDRSYPEVALRLHVADGLVTVMDVVGNKFAKRLEGTSISVEFLNSGKRIDNAHSSEDLQKKINLRRFLEMGINFAKSEKSKAAAAQAVSAAKARLERQKQNVQAVSPKAEKPASTTTAAEDAPVQPDSAETNPAPVTIQ